jgi:TRAP-type transport system small permease protein
MKDLTRFNLIGRCIDGAIRAIEIALGVALIVAVVINFTNVMGRYIFGYAFLSADELQIYIMIWIAFLGATVVTWRDQHLCMDVIRKSLPLFLQRLVLAFGAVVLIIVSGFSAVVSFRYVARIFALGQTGDMSGIPLWLPQSAVFVGFVLMLLMVAFVWIKAAWARLYAVPTDDGTGS